MLVVEPFFHHHAGEGLLADLYLEGSAQLGEGRLDEGHAHALAGGDGVVAGGHLAHLAAFGQHGIAMARNGAAFEFDADDAAGHTLGLLLHQCIAADELGLVEFAEHAQSGHHRRDVGRELIAIERQSHLEAQGVAASQSAGLAAPALDKTVPALADIVV